MKKIYLFGFIFIFMSVSCQKKQLNLNEIQLNPLRIDLAETSLNGSNDNVDLTTIQRLTQEQYNSLQLAKVKGLEDYDLGNLSMGRTLMSDGNGKILTIQIITDGEVSEYLLSYDKGGNLVDNLIVAYEDMVEYYSEISSNISENLITVQTINYTYDDPEENPGGVADTTIARYKITPDLKIITN